MNDEGGSRRCSNDFSSTEVINNHNHGIEEERLMEEGNEKNDKDFSYMDLA